MNPKLVKALQRHYAENKKDYWPQVEGLTAQSFDIDIESETYGSCSCDMSVDSKVSITAYLHDENDKLSRITYFETDDLHGFIEKLFELTD